MAAAPNSLRRRDDDGYALVALVAATTIMLILMSAAVPAWRYVVKNEREEELLFRGEQIAHAITAYQQKFGQPVSLEVMVKQKVLRQAYKDPMVSDGKWRFIRPGEVPIPGTTRPLGTSPSGGKTPPSTLIPGQSTTGPGGKAEVIAGPFMGVASRSTEKGLRIVGGRENYNEWIFMAHSVAGPHPVIGRQTGLLGGRPGASPFPGATPGLGQKPPEPR